MTSPSTGSTATADELPPYHESINVNEGYLRWAKQQPHQKDLSFACDGTFMFYASFAAFLACSFAWDPMGTPHSVALPQKPMVSRCDPVIVKLWHP
uniref:Uncharacterized protein n=1 Tax=Romanomermis culicivorax TaxID=13658 RepID=A0A915IBJ6_ROMCU